MSNPTPTSNQGVSIAILGVLLMVASLVCWVLNRLALISFFKNLSSNQNTLNEEVESVAQTLQLYGRIGILAGLLAMIFILVAHLALGYQSKWFRRYVMTMAVLWLFLFFPYGLCGGIILLLVFYQTKPEAPEEQSA